MGDNGPSVYTIKASSQNLIESVQSLEVTVAMIEQIRGGMATRAPFTHVQELVDALLRNVPYAGYSLGGADRPPFRVFRGRIENSRSTLSAPSEFSYRPVEHSQTLGRCHQPGTTVFYGASNLDTVLAELLPEIGDTVHVGVASAKPGTSLTFTAIGEIDNYRRYGRAVLGNEEFSRFQESMLNQMEDEQRIRAILVDAFFSDQFAQPASKPRDYKITAALAELILDAQNDGNRFLDGFAYPSVAHRGGINCAIRPDSFDSKMNWEQFMAFKITNFLGFGLYGRRQHATAASVNSDGAIEWKEIDG